MKTTLKLLSLVGLTLTVVPALFVFSGSISWDEHAAAMLAGTVLWFATAPFWMKNAPT